MQWRDLLLLTATPADVTDVGELRGREIVEIGAIDAGWDNY